MKINVNAYNEILSYEGTPVEIAELISLGVFGEWVPAEEMLDCGYEDEDEYENEDCDCDTEVSVEASSEEVPIEVVIDEADAAPIAEVTVDNAPNADECKEYVRKQIRKIYPDLSNEEFDRYYEFVADWVSVFENLEFLKQ
jgi:hypothetical protein